MKIHLKARTRPKLYSFTKITCQDLLMAEMLNCVPETVTVFSTEVIKNFRQTNNPNLIHSFFHGAGLKVGDAKDEFFLYCLKPDGSDVLSAIEELKMLDHLRLARKHFQEMKNTAYFSGQETITLRVTCH